jgi:hypothetical protein
VQEWEPYIPENEYSAEKSIVRGLVGIKQGKHVLALQCINESRLKIYNEVSDFVVFSSSSNSFDKVVKIQ